MSGAVIKAGHRDSRIRPRGVATVWLMIVLSVLAGLLAAITAQHLSDRHDLDRRQKRIQADWLARSGVELAVARLLEHAADYHGETIALIPGSQVSITVQVKKDSTSLAAVTAAGIAWLASPCGGASLLAASAHLVPIDGGSVIIQITSEARYNTDEPPVIIRKQSRLYRRVINGSIVRIERLDSAATQAAVKER